MAPLPPPRRASAGVVNLAYDEAGASAIPLVLVHGYCGSRLDFLEVREALSKKRRVIALDLRGHGASDRKTPYTIAGLMRDVEGLLDTLGEARFDLLGHSMGGMVALRLALARPARVRTLTLMATTAGPFAIDVIPDREVAPLARYRASVARALRRDAARDLARSLAAGPEVKRRFEDAIRYGHTRVDPLAAHELAIDFGRMRSVEDALERYPGPALVLVGEGDAPFLEPSRALARGLPRAELRELPGAGHFPQYEARAAFLEALGAHLDGA
jgi:pimeloyl-ACP methyl ester carboxylesterase